MKYPQKLLLTRKLTGFCGLWLLTVCTTASAAVDQQTFASCIADLGERARVAGVETSLVTAVLPEIAPIERVIQLDRKQPEFVQTFGAYVDKRVTEGRVERGRALLAKHQPFLQDLLERYGVPPRYLIAFWGLETNFGSYLGNIPTLNALATLACDPRRSDFFAGEFVDALQLMEREELPLETLRGSWAGALGHTQFMPSSYLRYAVDGDGDGRVDLWASERDALASGANFLRSLGWTPELRWGRQVTLPEGFPYELASLGKKRSLRAWASMGVRQLNGASVPALDLDAALLLPAGHLGPAFLVYENFRVVMRWNQSLSYALSVGLLADRLAGAPPLALGEAASAPLRSADIENAQRALNALGHEAGEPDGVLGKRTRAALRAFQLENELPADGYPDARTLETLAAVTLP
ncbi:lytic murein transglycosylase [Congregibacter sp.]|uniref:lytic murein transglycosylase n=1 Tax=Congregibacter sp. TaxID=2744308 RepID=UPI003F6AD12F